MNDINSQVLDAVTLTNTHVVAMSPAMSMASLYQNMSHAATMAAINAVHAQQQTNIQFQAATTLGIEKMFSVI